MSNRHQATTRSLGRALPHLAIVAMLACTPSEILNADENSGTVMGRVLRDGQPVAGATVAFQISEELPREVTTDDDGRYSIRLPRGEWNARLENVSVAICPRAKVNVRIDEETTLDLQCAGPAEVSGPWTARYTNTFTTCDPAPLPTYETAVEALASVLAVALVIDWLFPDVSDPINGEFDPQTATFTGTSPAVDIGNGLTATEEWELSAAGWQVVDLPSLIGTAKVAVWAGQNQLCQRDFTVEIVPFGPFFPRL